MGTTDLAEVINAYLGDGTYLNGSDTATVVILSPIGGEVIRNPLSQAAPTLSLMTVAAATVVYFSVKTARK